MIRAPKMYAGTGGPTTFVTLTLTARWRRLPDRAIGRADRPASTPMIAADCWRAPGLCARCTIRSRRRFASGSHTGRGSMIVPTWLPTVLSGPDRNDTA